MIPPESAYYRLVAGVAVVRLDDGNILLKSDVVAMRIEGEFAPLLANRVLPLLDGRRSFSEVAAQLNDLDTVSLRANLEALVRAGVLRVSAEPISEQGTSDVQFAPLQAMVDALGIPLEVAAQRLRNQNIAIFGLEGHGAYLALFLAQCGVGELILVDPFPCEPGNLTLTPLFGRDVVGQARQSAVQSLLSAADATSSVQTPITTTALSRQEVMDLAPGRHLLVGCFDPGFSAMHHWINSASLTHGIPALYAECRGTLGLIGPLVFPGDTACYMCYRMRSIACEADFEAAMSYEEVLDQQKRGELHKRALIPSLPAYVGSVLGAEILKLALGVGQPTLAGTVMEFDTFSLRSHFHSVLQKPDCPTCKKKWLRQHPTLTKLMAWQEPRGDLGQAAEKLISRRTGIVQGIFPVKVDPSEPARPLVYAARIANHRYLSAKQLQDDQQSCSGKGMNAAAAQLSALGEAVERYSSGYWEADEIVYARRPELSGQTLDPARLVLYRSEQYADLPYHPYMDDTSMGWVRARSLGSDEDVWLPAIAVFLNYQVHEATEFICATTSNGLAAGSTLTDAVLAAAYEVLERDAFMIAWLNRLACHRTDAATHPDAEMVALYESYRRRGVTLELFKLPTDHPCHVFMSIGMQQRSVEGPFAVVGLGADLDAARAARKAMLEVGQVRPALRHRMREPATAERLTQLVADPHQVTSLEDHDLLYASRERAEAFRFLVERPLEPFDWQQTDVADISEASATKLQRLAEHLSVQGSDLIYYNLTPPDMNSLNLYTVRAVVPDFQPIHFGWRERRLGGRRLFELPQRLGQRAQPATLADLNDDPHPLA